jgi:hypothetical protein
MKAKIKEDALLIPKTPINCMLLLEMIEGIQNTLPQFKAVTKTDKKDIMHCRLYVDGNPITGNIMQKVSDYINLNNG